LLQNWPRNVFDIEDDEYKTLILTYNKELDSLISTNNITKSLKGKGELTTTHKRCSDKFRRGD
jgi:hypothetical protein